jgi:hypothetical protein
MSLCTEPNDDAPRIKDSCFATPPLLVTLKLLRFTGGLYTAKLVDQLDHRSNSTVGYKRNSVRPVFVLFLYVVLAMKYDPNLDIFCNFMST